MPTPTIFSARPTRSRYSSPFTNGTGSAASEPPSTMTEAAPRQKTLTDMWSEPALPAARPSFAEAGFARGGTVANMAPLGTLPTPKMMKSAGRGDVRDGAERVKRSEASNATTPETPEPPILTTTQRSQSAKTEGTTPIPALSPKTPREQTSPPQTVTQMEPEPLDQGISAAASTIVSAKASQSPRPSPLENSQSRGHLPAPYNPPYDDTWDDIEDDSIMVDLETSDKVIEAAVDRAVLYGRYPTAYALRTLYDENRSDERIVRMLESNYYGVASLKQRQEFSKLLSEKKREGKKDHTAEYYFNGDGSDPPPRPVLSAVSAALTYDSPNGIAPYLEQARSNSQNPTSPHEFDIATLLKKQKNTPYVSKYPPIANAYASFSANVKPYKSLYSNLPETPTQNGTPAPALEPAIASSPPVSAPTAPMTRTRSGSMSSTSSLSSVDEKVLETDLVDSNGLPSAVGDIPSPRSSRKKRAAIANGRDHRDENGDEYMDDVDDVAYGVEVQPAVAKLWNFSSRKKKSKKSKKISRGKAAHAAATGPNASAPGPANTTRATRASSNLASASDSNLPSSRISSRHSTQEPLQLHNNHRQPSTQPQPIPATQPPKHKTGPKTYTFSTVPRPSTSAASTPTSTQLSFSSNPVVTRRANAASANAEGDMAPARLLQEAAPVSSKPERNPYFPSNVPSGIKIKISKKKLDTPLEPESEESIRRKRAAREKTNAAPVRESFERHQVQLPQADETASEGGDFIPTAPSRRPTKKRVLNTRETRNRYPHGSENSSPTLLSFQPDHPFGSVSTSRAGTPLVGNRPTRKAKGPRTKHSPEKKKGGVSGGERNSPSGGPTENKDENDEQCSACNGNGELVLCDGCTRSFHFKCVDPPMIAGAPDLPPSWFCNSCDFSHHRRQNAENPNSAFGALLYDLEARNPRAFRLPQEIREHFEGVVTGADGEYEEPVPPTKAKNKGGWSEEAAPDYYRMKDAKGKPILCHHCHTSASPPNRIIIPCSTCGLYWHLDCLETPLAKEPPAGKPWQCPAHVEDLLSVLPMKLGPAHRWRKIKGKVAIVPSIPRGTRNNGHIEIEPSPSDDDEPKGFYEETQFGTVYKLPEEGLKLDFISKVKAQGGGISRSGFLNRNIPSPNVPEFILNTRTVAEQQAALNLALLSTKATDSADSTGSLIKALLDNAPQPVLELLAESDATNLDQSSKSLKNLGGQEMRSLKALQEYLNRELGTPDDDNEAPTRKSVKRKRTSSETIS